MLFCGNLSVPGNDADIENIRITFILQTAQPLDAFNFRGGQNAPCKLNFHTVDKSAALKHPGVGIAQRFQTVLQKVSPFASGAHKQQLFLQTNAVQRRGNLA